MKTIKKSSNPRQEEPESSVLYVVGTPIGNLNDISERSINLLSKVSLILCEDTRQTKKLLNVLGINNKLISFNEYNSRVKTKSILNQLNEGSSIALVSDAGMPVISDPGEYLIKEARLKNYEVICSPGPCAALTALVSSGLPSNNFLFIGFLSKKNIEKDNQFKIIKDNFCTTIIYESPKRVKSFLKDLRAYCEENRKIHVCKELTKRYEFHWEGTLKEIIHDLENIDLRGEFTILVGPKEIKEEFADFDKLTIRKDLEELIKLGLKRSSAASYLAHKNGLPRNIIYNLKNNAVL